MTIRVKARDVYPRMRLDLEGDSVADPEHNHPMYEQEFQVVIMVEEETAECVTITLADGTEIGFPPDHEIGIDPEARYGKTREWWLRQLEPYNAQPPFRNETAPIHVLAKNIMGHNKAVAHYFRTALWATNDESDESGGEPLDQNYDVRAFADEDIIQGVEECLMFLEENAEDIDAGMAIVLRSDDSEDEHAGHDFFLTRNGHGAGFWDGDWPEEAGKRLTEAAKKFGESQPYLGDDQTLYWS